MNTKLLLSVAATAAVISLLPLSVQAQSDVRPNDRAEKTTQRTQVERDERKTERDATKTARCENIATRKTTRVGNYAQNQERHQNRYAHVSQILTTVIERGNEAGLDTSDVVAAQVGLDAKVAAFQAAASSAHTALANLDTSGCGNSDGTFLAELDALKIEFDAVKEAAQQLHSYYLEVVKPAVQDLKNQAQTARDTQ